MGLTLETTPEPPPWDRMFWVRYLSAGVDFRGCESLKRDGRRLQGVNLPDMRVAFGFPQDFRLEIVLSGAAHRLELAHPSLRASALLGWMDCQHMSDLFLREEFEVLVRHLDSLADTGREPWMARLLLGFYVAPLPEDGGWFPPMIRAAMDESGLFTADEAAWVETYIRTVVRSNFQWLLDRQRGWVACGQDAYSLRTRGNREFPFSLVRELFSRTEGR